VTMVQRLGMVFWRPLLSLAVAVLIFLLAEGHVPRVADVLAKPACRVLASLSYAMYLMQSVGQRAVEEPYVHAIAASLDRAHFWLLALAVYGGVALIILGTAPLALLSYTLVERPGIHAGRRCAEMLSRLGRQAKSGAPTGKLVGQREKKDLEACPGNGYTVAGMEPDAFESAPDDVPPPEIASGDCGGCLTGGAERCDLAVWEAASLTDLAHCEGVVA